MSTGTPMLNVLPNMPPSMMPARVGSVSRGHSGSRYSITYRMSPEVSDPMPTSSGTDSRFALSGVEAATA